MDTPIGNIPEWVRWIVGVILVPLVRALIGYWQQHKSRRKPPPSALSRPRFDEAHAVAVDANGEPDIFRLLHWQTRYADALPGREQELCALLAWAREDTGNGAIKPALLSAPGGAGKTRLAAELAHRLNDEGWHAGFLPRDMDDHFPLPARRHKPAGVLVIIDYPEERGEQALQAIFSTIRQWHDKTRLPTRLLLLSRDVDDSRWRILLQRHLPKAEGLYLPLRGMSALAADQARDLARQVYAALKDVAPFSPLPENWRQAFAQWLDAHPREHGLPLFIIAFMLDAMLRGRPDAQMQAAQVLQALVARERQRLHPISGRLGLGEEGLERLLALASLADGLPESSVRALAETDIVANADNLSNIDALARTPWWSREENRLLSLAPDRLAAAFVADALLPSTPRDGLPVWLAAALKGREERFCTHLPRLLWDIREAAPGAEKRLVEALKRMLDDNPERAAAFFPITTIENHRIAPLAVHVCNLLLNQTETREGRAVLLNNLANHLSNLGQHEQALEPAQEAMAIYHDLAKENPQAYRPHLAMSLNNLANCLSNLGQHEQALEPAHAGKGKGGQR